MVPSRGRRFTTDPPLPAGGNRLTAGLVFPPSAGRAGQEPDKETMWWFLSSDDPRGRGVKRNILPP